MLNKAEYIYSVPDRGDSVTPKIIPFINYRKTAPERCLDMLLAKYRGEPFQTEVMMEAPERIAVPSLSCLLEEATILLITDGGLVPAGNPDALPSSNAGCYGEYSILGKKKLLSRDYEVSHQGYDSTYVKEDPNRLLPVDAVRELEKEGLIGRLYNRFLSTAGVMTPTEDSIALGKEIASYVVSHPIDAVIITSACGTSTRCGAYIGKEIEEQGIPVVQITNLTQIAADTGVSRIMRGNNVCYPCGDPTLTREGEFAYRKKLIRETLKQLEEMPE